MSGPWEEYAAPGKDGPWSEYKPAEAPKPAAAKSAAPQELGFIDAAAGFAKGELSYPEAVEAFRKKKMGQFADEAGGIVRGAGSIGRTLMTGADAYGRLQTGRSMDGLMDKDRAGRAAMDETLGDMGADTKSLSYQGMKLGTEIAGTMGVGGALANGVRAAAPASPLAGNFANSLASGGFRTGATAPQLATRGGRAVDAGVRVVGGGISSGAATATINPEHAGTGFAVGAALPPVLRATGKVAGYGGRALNALVAPFTTAGQERVLGGIINKFAKDGPTALNAVEHVPGSTPTLAEATGNAGIAGLQRSARNMPDNINRFVERETANAKALTEKFDDVAGDAGKLDFFKSSRDSAANDLYARAAQVDIGANMTPAARSQITQLMQRPSIISAVKQAKTWAKERGEIFGGEGSMRGLHDMKKAVDDQISIAVRAGEKEQAKALMATKEKLLGVIETISPAYREARVTFAEMSKPINQMEVLQGLKLTNTKGEMTLGQVQRALDSIGKQQAAPGARAAKDLTSAQIGTLQAIRDDLLRKGNTALGKAAGSDTFQNFATNNILSTMLPGRAGEIVGGKVGNAMGQIGQILYNKPNEAMRNRLVDYLLDPQAGRAAMAVADSPILGNQLSQRLQNLRDATAPNLYRAAPALESSR